MLKIGIVEDQKSCIDELVNALKETGVEFQIVFSVDNVDDAIKSLKTEEIDLAITDVEIRGGTIFDVLSNIKKINCGLLFCSAHEVYALKAFKYSALDYILKPINSSDLKDVLIRVQNQSLDVNRYTQLQSQINMLKELMLTNVTSKTIALPTSSGINFIEVVDVIRVEADASYSTFFVKQGAKIIVSKPLKEYVDMLEQHGFYRIHKSHVVNMREIRQYIKGEGGSLILSNGDEVVVSRRKKLGLLEELAKY